MKTITAIIKLITPICAIFSIFFLESKALSMGINGAYLAISCALLAGLGGFEVKELKNLITRSR